MSQMQTADQFDDEKPLTMNVYEQVRRERQRHGKHAYMCGAPIIPFAYAMCAYLILEGLFILYQDPEDWHITGPYASSEIGFLEFVGYCNILAAIAGAVGIWLGHNIVQGWRKLARMHTFCCNCGLITVLAWRGAVCLMFPPWAGILLAFTPDHHHKVFLFLAIFGYIGFCIFIEYVFTMTLIRCVHDSQLFQYHLDSQHLHERRVLLRTAHEKRLSGETIDGEDMHDHDIEPDLFGFLPMSETVFVYALLMTVAMASSWLHICVSGKTGGGWAFFSQTEVVVQTYWLEFFLYPIVFLACIAGLLGSSSLTGNGILDKSSSMNAMSAFLLANMLRFALQFAITGMDLLEKNTCGFYVNGVASFAYADPKAPKNNSLMHCPPFDILFLITIFVLMVLDGYMIWATFELYHHAEDWEILAEPEAA